MSPIWMIFLLSLALGLKGLITSWRSQKNDSDPANQVADAEAEKRWAAQCNPGESLWVVCHYKDMLKDEYYVLTSQRLIVESDRNPHQIPLESITKVSVEDSRGWKTSDSSKALRIKIWSDQGKVTLVRTSEKFTELARCFIAMQG